MDSKLLAGLILLFFAILCSAGVYAWADDACKKRGGHLEVVVGGRGGYVCVDTQR